MSEDERRETIEDVLGEFRTGFGFGFRVRWSVQDHWADVEVFLIVMTQMEDDQSETPLFEYEGTCDTTPDIKEADPYLKGYIKWDGCTELGSDRRPHWCGPRDYQKHCALLEYLYKRAFELMGREPEEEWS